MIVALIAVIALCIHLGLGWWTVAAAVAYAFTPFGDK